MSILNKRFYSLVVFTLIFSWNLNSQNTKLKLKDGTTVVGDMVYGSWFNTTDEINIKVQEKNTVFKTSKIYGFEFNDEKYIRRQVELNINKQNLQNLSDVIELEFVKKELFLKVEVEGRLGLYSYNDGRLHFFVSKDENFIELIKLKRATRATLNKYMGQLNILFSDCDNSPKPENVKFTISSLSKGIVAYNSCFEEGNNYIAKNNEKVELSFYVLGGFKSTSYNLELNGFQITSEGGFVPNFGIGVGINLSPRSKKLELYNDFVFQKYDFEAFRSLVIVSLIQTIENFLTLDMTHLEVNNLIRYNFGQHQGPLNVFVTGGLSHNFLVTNNSKEFAVNTILGEKTRVDIEPFQETEAKSYILSGSVGVGIRYRFINGEVRYGFGGDLINDMFTGQGGSGEDLSEVNFNNFNVRLFFKLF